MVAPMPVVRAGWLRGGSNMMQYRYSVAGRAAGEQTWEAKGVVEIDRPGDFPDVMQQAMTDSYRQLTQGKAIYGKPGLGCNGPYTITRMLIEEMQQ